MFTTIALLCFVSVADISAVTRVARAFNLVEFSGGYMQPTGRYGRLGIIDFADVTDRRVRLDADKVFDPSFTFNFSFGKLLGDRLLTSVGFRYTKVNTLDTFYVTGPDVGDSVIYSYLVGTPSFNQYDLTFDINYFLLSPVQSVFAPYIGAGVDFGLLAQTLKGFESESDANLGLTFNFGADIKVWEDPNTGNFLALSSINEWHFAGLNDHPKFLNIGGGIRYYFRP